MGYRINCAGVHKSGDAKYPMTTDHISVYSKDAKLISVILQCALVHMKTSSMSVNASIVSIHAV